MEKKGAKAQLIVWSIVLVIICLIIVDLIINGNFNGSFFGLINEGEYVILVDETIDVSTVSNLQVKMRSGTINIYKTEDKDVRVVQKGYEKTREEEKVQINNSGNTLSVSQGRGKVRFFYFGFGLEDMLIEIYLPEKEFDRISAECTSGKIVVENFACKEVYLKLSSGELRVDELKTESAEFKMTSGDMYIDNVSTSKLTAKTSSGRMDIKGAIKNIDLDLTSGDIDVKTSIMPETIKAQVTSGETFISIPENDGFDINCHKTSGEFKTDFNITTTLGSNNNRNIVGKYKDGGSKIDLKVTSGTIRLEKN